MDNALTSTAVVAVPVSTPALITIHTNVHVCNRCHKPFEAQTSATLCNPCREALKEIYSKCLICGEFLGYMKESSNTSYFNKGRKRICKNCKKKLNKSNGAGTDTAAPPNAGKRLKECYEYVPEEGVKNILPNLDLCAFLVDRYGLRSYAVLSEKASHYETLQSFLNDMEAERTKIHREPAPQIPLAERWDWWRGRKPTYAV